MAIRKISELPLVNPLNESIRPQLSGSYMEISLADDAQLPYKFKSRKINYSDLEKSIIYAIVGEPGNEPSIVFYTHDIFKNPVTMLNGFNLSGDIFINKEIENVEDYKVDIKTGDATIATDGDIVLRSDSNIILRSEIDKNANNGGIFLESENVIICKDINGNSSGIRFQVTEDSIYMTLPTMVQNNFTVTGEQTTLSGKTIVKHLSCTGNATFDNVIRGTALRAKWADLAEMYDSDSEYEPGTLVKFGGEKEITIATDEANAVITTRPGLLLGENDTNTKLPIALVGKVPVKVIGPVKKFDKLILSVIPGIATKKIENNTTQPVIGISLETIDCQINDINLVESVVQMKF